MPVGLDSPARPAITENNPASARGVMGHSPRAGRDRREDGLRLRRIAARATKLIALARGRRSIGEPRGVDYAV
jgi:hypothetical protein